MGNRKQDYAPAAGTSGTSLMDSVKEFVTELNELTAQLVQDIEQLSYEDLAEFADRREELVERILMQKQHLTDEDKKKLQKLAQHDQLILNKMTDFKQEAGEWIRKQNMITVQKSAYNSYHAADGMFFDRRN